MKDKDFETSNEKQALPRFLMESNEESFARFYKRFGPLIITKEEMDDRLKEWRKLVPDTNNMTERQWRLHCDILDKIQEEKP